jgi:hypothetical protein
MRACATTMRAAGALLPGNVTLVNAAVTSAPGTLPFTWYPSAPGNSTLVPDEKVAMQARSVAQGAGRPKQRPGPGRVSGFVRLGVAGCAVSICGWPLVIWQSTRADLHYACCP